MCLMTDRRTNPRPPYHTPVAVKGYSGLSIPDETAEAVDQFMEDHAWMGFRSRTELILTAVREYLQRHGTDQQARPPQEASEGARETSRVKGKH